jgi:hypothetical protein
VRYDAAFSMRDELVVDLEPRPLRSEGNSAQVALGIACLASGVALVSTILFHRSLRITLALAAATVGSSAAGIWRRSTPHTKAILRERARFGLLAGLMGTASYDATRWLLVFALGYRVNPFGALPLFGWSLLGPGASSPEAWIIGFIYHLSNGTLFGISYAVLLGQRSWWVGIVWALGLEVAMMSLYPMWLSLRSVMGEFTLMSITGHVAYGTVVGQICHRRFRPAGDD